MMTKKEFCNTYINNYCKENEIKRDAVEEEVFKDTTLGICLEFLNEIHNDDIKEYLSDRCGLFYTVPSFDEKGDFLDDVKHISTRDLIELLPN